eukprot:CAMPEP_0198644118 /NCGR_PEP_ID=MMETSP1467-20131203/413_1 /TAXON_ID=1462469 /ORGANISM="unid. sp., Strain CCMP2135" /LENGTH=34 /DNA_ID= /DNA_START= /DNA_END= /DNA_ORIENTATION=
MTSCASQPTKRWNIVRLRASLKSSTKASVDIVAR